jgi:hypothetical protein
VEPFYAQRIVMTHTHKYVYNGFDFDEFYDLANDPCELVNLAFPGNAPEPARGLPGEEGAWPPLASDIESTRGTCWRRCGCSHSRQTIASSTTT